MIPRVSHAFRVQRTVSARHCNCHAPALMLLRDSMILPSELSSFVGRGAHIEAVAARLETDRLVTLTGAGGIGKTRLALQVARRPRPGFEQSAWTALSTLIDEAGVPSAVAGALSGRADPRVSTGEMLAAVIRDRRLLLVLDNCEHVIAACANLVYRLLDQCPGVRVLATSREPLGVPGEVVYPVPPLECAVADRDAAEPGRRGEAMQLFVERAQARDPDLPLTPGAEAIAARICRTLDGVPLAIELAAACTSSMTLAEILERLDDGLGLLRLGSRAAPPRQQSLRASIEWSHRLLQEPERALLRRLSVLDDEFTLEAAEAVGGFDGVRSAEVAYVLDRLVAQSLVHAAKGGATTRYRVSAPIRQFGREKLDEAGETRRLQTRIAEWNERPAATAPPSPSRSTSTSTSIAVAVAADERARLLEAAPRRAAPKGGTRRTSILSEREHAVASLIAAGRSNREIADELVITKKTAEAHVSHILTKLGLGSRVQIATWRLQQGFASAASA